MGPRPFGRGNQDQDVLFGVRPAASMGPRPFGRGNATETGLILQEGGASMGPRPFGRGNLPVSTPPAPLPKRFNGATAIRPWERTAGRRLAHGDARRFNGATAIRPWE